MDRSTPVNILLVEDNEDHATFTLKALAGDNPAHRTFWVKDGQEALDFILRRGPWADAAKSPRPDLILLDINMPKLDGHAVLRHVKGDEGLRSIPVIMLTTSDRTDEVTKSYHAGANSYVTKPASFSLFVERIKMLKEYWVLTSLLPAV